MTLPPRPRRLRTRRNDWPVAGPRWGALLLALALGACASRPPAPGPVPQAPVPPTTAAQEPPAAPPTGSAPEPPAKPHTVVLDRGDEAEEPRSLIEASRLAKERQRTAAGPVAVITDKNLAEYASRGKLTMASPAPKPQADAAAPGQGTASGVEQGSGKDEAYWRTEARSLREKWRAAVDAVTELEARAEALRHQFYSQEDVYIRDTRVKPAWDRVLDRLEEARREADAGRGELTTLLEEGRRAGALPGWLREGIELEPEEQRTLEDDFPEADVVEPDTIDD